MACWARRVGELAGFWVERYARWCEGKPPTRPGTAMSIRFLCMALMASILLIGATPSPETPPTNWLRRSAPSLAAPQDAAPEAAESEASSEDEAEPEVAAEVLFDVQSFIPGKMAHLVVILKIPEHWHIYWESAGEAGMGTRIDVTGPKGWKVGKPRFPGPMLYTDGQGNVAYTLEGEVGFFVPITPPDDAPVDQTAAFQVKMQWLLCQDICLMGSLDRTLELEVQRGTPKRNTDRRLVGLRKQLARRGFVPAEIGYAFGGTPEKAQLTFSTKDSREFEFFPLPDSPLVIDDRPEGTKSETFSQRNFDLKPSLGGVKETIAVQGVVRVTRKDQVSFYEIDFQGPQNREPTKQVLGHGSLPTVPKKQ